MQRFHLTLLSVAFLTAVACGPKEQPQEAETAPPPAPAPAPVSEPETAVASAELTAREGLNLTGNVTFTQSGDTVTVEARVEGLDGAGEHGFHVHAIGDCSAPDFTSAGGHFNPNEGIHGGPEAPERHAGDLGNITIGEDGVGTLSLTTDLLSVRAGPNSVVGRAVILHEGTDDLVSQPTGDAGGRLACGVVVEG